MIAFFLWYSNTSKAYRVFNKKPLIVQESMHKGFFSLFFYFYKSNPFDPRKVVENYDVNLVRKVKEINIDNVWIKVNIDNESQDIS